MLSGFVLQYGGASLLTMLPLPQEVASSARQLTWTIELSSLAQQEAGTSNKGLEADEEAQINMLKEALTAQLRNPLQEPQRKAVMACLQV